MSEAKLTIGYIARSAGVNIETVRYYQRRELLEEPPKPLGSHRHYPPEAVKRVRFIKRAQQLGFTLEVTSLLTLEDAEAAGRRGCLRSRSWPRSKPGFVIFRECGGCSRDWSPSARRASDRAPVRLSPR